MCVITTNCEKNVCMQGYSPIHVDRSSRVSNLGDKSVPYLKDKKDLSMQLVYFTRLEESSLVPPGFLTAQFLQKT